MLGGGGSRGSQRRKPRPRVRGGGSRDSAPGPAPPRPAPPRPVAPPRPGAGPARAPLRRPAGGERVSPPPTPEVAASPLRRRGDCWEGRRDGGGGTRSWRPVRVKRGGSRSRSGSRPEREAQVREGGLGREAGLGAGLGQGRHGPTLVEGARPGRHLGLLGRGVRRPVGRVPVGGARGTETGVGLTGGGLWPPRVGAGLALPEGPAPTTPRGPSSDAPCPAREVPPRKPRDWAAYAA